MPGTLIVGAGPAGAALAFLLARRGLEVTLVERHDDFAREFRGEILMPSGIDAIAQMGLQARFEALPQEGVQTLEAWRGPRRLFRLRPGELGFGPRVVSQPALLEMLAAEAARYPGFRLERGAAARVLLVEGGRVSGVRLQDGRELRAPLVVGTDGRDSILRRQSGLHETRLPQSFDVVWFRLPRPEGMEASVARLHLGRGHFALDFPTYGGHLQVGWVIQKGAFGDLQRQGVDGWLAEMTAHVSPALAAHLRAHREAVAHPFRLNVVCDALVKWTRPGLLLLGDAAHPMSPVGGQGINLALRDALVAANHLVPVLAGGGPLERLDAAALRVQEERLPETTEVQRLQQVPPRFLFGFTPGQRALRDVLTPLLIRSGLLPVLFGRVLGRFGSGVTRVRLEA